MRGAGEVRAGEDGGRGRARAARGRGLPRRQRGAARLPPRGARGAAQHLAEMRSSRMIRHFENDGLTSSILQGVSMQDDETDEHFAQVDFEI